jgi:hypothetical protein
MFRDLIPLLADRFHVVAPDLPGFGQSDMPPHDRFSYTFDNVARVAMHRKLRRISVNSSPMMTEPRMSKSVPVAGLALRIGGGEPTSI